VGTPEFLQEEYGLTTPKIYAQLKPFLEKSSGGRRESDLIAVKHIKN
jgi:transketolase